MINPIKIRCYYTSKYDKTPFSSVIGPGKPGPINILKIYNFLVRIEFINSSRTVYWRTRIV